MSVDPSPPPSPTEQIQNWLTNAERLIALIVENFRRGTWIKRLLLLDALVVFSFNAKVVTTVLRTFALLGEDEALPNWYGAAFGTTVGLLFLAALLVALFTPAAAKVEAIDLEERKAIKGLRPFTADDAEIFTRLQRNRSLRECLESITSENFRFGIFMGESGCGKTSFLQAGVVPKLTEPEADYRAVYVRFSDRPPLNAIRDDLAKQLNIPKENLSSTDLVILLQTAVDAIDKPLLLFFDQFEQFFVHAPRKPDRQPFIQALTNWYHSDLPVRVLVCMRGDMVDRLVELHQALGYALSPQEVFRLEKFSPEEATRVLQVIAETEKLRFEESFVKELAERELAAREDGAISPVDLQILGWMIARQNADELRAFNQQAFQKIGGVEGLMTRFLEKALEARMIKSHREAAVKVLLALTDLDRNVRAGALSLSALQDKLKDTVRADEVTEAVRWLVRGDVRLITPEEKAEETVYELAHERLIPAVRKVAGKELTEAQRANELLDRRVSEWQGNQFSSRYLFSPIELWQLKRQQPYLEWGANRRQKEQLWRKSWRRLYRTVLVFLLLLLIFLSTVQSHRYLRYHSDLAALQSISRLRKQEDYSGCIEKSREFLETPRQISSSLFAEAERLLEECELAVTLDEHLQREIPQILRLEHEPASAKTIDEIRPYVQVSEQEVTVTYNTSVRPDLHEEQNIKRLAVFFMSAFRGSPDATFPPRHIDFSQLSVYPMGSSIKATLTTEQWNAYLKKRAALPPNETQKVTADLLNQVQISAQ